MNRSTRMVCMALFVGMSVTVYADTLNCQQQHCVGIVDAGSTGSRLHIYTYDLDEHRTPTHITEKWAKKVKPGLATLENNQAAMDSYLNNLVMGAPDAAMPVYVYATAGMRLLSQPKQAEVYGYMRHWFDNQGQWELKTAKTVTGKEEGLFGWLAVNYQLGALADASKPLSGVMDMGGASVQVSFPVQHLNQVAPDDLQDINLYGQHHTVFIHSFLGLGQTELSHQFFNRASCFPNHYPLPDGHDAEGNARLCKNEVAVLINAVHQVNRVVRPALKMNKVTSWYAMGGVVDMVKAKPYDFSGTSFDNQTMLMQGNSNVCSLDWANLQAQYPGNDYLYGDCLYPAYYYALMVEGYGIDSQQSINYLSATNGTDWTVGAVFMLNNDSEMTTHF